MCTFSQKLANLNNLQDWKLTAMLQRLPLKIDLILIFVFFFFAFQETPIRWGICAPKQCSEEDVTKALHDIFSGSYICSTTMTFEQQ